MNLRDLLHLMIQKRSSDLHLKEGRPPIMRIDGRLTPLEMEILSNADMREIIQTMTDEKTRKKFEENNEMDLAYNLEGVARFRANAFKQMGKLEVVMRAIPIKIPTLEELNMPPVLKEIALYPRGLVLVTGTTGSGKSTTLAAMINAINESYYHHIVTIEDPIEFVHTDKRCSITQREVGLDTDNFSNALRYVLRQDPDVILIGEMRDMITVGTAISAAETGHMVFSTLHTMDTIQTINRILDFFPKEQQVQVRSQLASALKAVISLRLVTKADGIGRVPAAEVMIVTPTIKGLIEEGRFSLIKDMIKDGEKDGLQTFDQSLIRLYKQGLITVEEAKQNASSPQEIDLAMKGITSSKSSAQSILDTMMKEQGQKEQTGEIKRGRQLLDSGKFAEAHEVFEKLLLKFPANKEASECLKTAKAGLNSEQHQEAVRTIINEGMMIYKKGNIRGAIVKWQEGLGLDPGNVQIKSYIKSAEENIGRAAQIPGILEQGVEIYKTGNIEGAIAKWQEVFKLDANNAQAKTYITGARHKAAELKLKREIEALYKRGNEERDKGNPIEGMLYMKRALDLKPDSKEIAESFTKMKNELSNEKFGNDVEAEVAGEAFKMCVDSLAAEDYLGALKEIKKVIEKRPLDKKAKDYQEKIKNAFKDRLEELQGNAEEAYGARDLAGAMSYSKAVLKIDPASEFALKYIRDLKPVIDEEVKKAYSEAMDFYGKGALKESKEKLEAILLLDAENHTAKKRLEEVKQRLSAVGGV